MWHCSKYLNTFIVSKNILNNNNNDYINTDIYKKNNIKNKMEN